MTKSWSPAYRIETARTVLRCWAPQDAGLLLQAVSESIDQLQAWMPWAADEPTGVEEKIRLLRAWRAAFDRDEDYLYGIFSPTENAVLGGTGLHKRLKGNGLEIGYWIHVAQMNRGLATEVSAALTHVAFAIHQVDRVEIHCDPANVRSAAIPRKLGYSLEATLPGQGKGIDGLPRASMIWILLRENYAGTPAATLPLRGYDAAGREIHMTSDLSEAG